MFYADRYFKERYSAKVAQMLALSGELTENDVLIVRGRRRRRAQWSRR